MDVMDEVGCISLEAIAAKDKDDADAKKVPVGRWEGQVFTWNQQEFDPSKEVPAELVGKRVYSIGVMLYDCPEVGKKKSGFFKVTPDEILNDNGKPKGKYKNAISLAKITGTGGQPFTETLEQAKVTRAVYDVAEFEPEPDKKITFLRGVYPVR